MRALAPVLVVLALLGVSSALRSTRAAPPVAETVAPSWSATTSEQLSWEGLRASYAKVDADLAPIVTDARTRDAVIRYVATRAKVLGKAEDDLVSEARARHKLPASTPLNYDANAATWVAAITTEAR